MCICYNAYYRYMHIIPGTFIRSVFEYFLRKSPDWSEKGRLLVMTFDEMYIDPACDIDRLLDMPINPNNHKNAQIIMTRRLCGEGKWPYFVDTDYAVSVDDVVESALAFDACDLTLLAISCDQGICSCKNLAEFQVCLF